MPEAEQTKDKDYEFLSYWTFEAVEYDRYMAWKAGKGWIAIGPRVTTRRDTNGDDEDVLRQGQSVVVSETDFKLVRKA
ncbi:hypothetical protein ONS95_011638 [Cadophora gregata]|uniref:uncharacterized protein n=1 Tax=Cadophora gregata TaxID=51156 RepID=UPI0026DA8B28|nr:uncharacterized protein ONS95_011638 [Cadophora gregata]KAK0120232.1 hypothetical protein ONS95_011638 [Cadophora gregata]KAK0121268.1 hypothetical protein ONS96_011443 [Cadophora gregata f. sp. sojae]